MTGPKVLSLRTERPALLSRICRYAALHKRLVSLLLCAAIVSGSFGLYKTGAQAQSSTYFASSCLGGWENTSLAEGEPDVRGLLDEHNSALLSGDRQAQIFCSGFAGEIPEGSTHTGVRAHISWQTRQVDPPATTTIVADESFESAAIEIIDLTEDEPAVIELPITEPVEVESVPGTDHVPDEAVESVVEESDPVEAESAADEPAPSEAEPAAETSAFIRYILPRAHAQELEEGASTTTEASAVSTAFFEVLYTLDGVVWHSLGLVEQVDGDSSFEIPISEFTSVDDLSELQLAVHTLPTVETRTDVLLDAMWVEVEYTGGLAPLEELLTPIEDVLITPAATVLSIRIFDKEIIIDARAAHGCEAETFRVDMSHERTRDARILLSGSAGEGAELEIGALPQGIDIRFAATNEYVYRPASGEETVELTLANERGAQEGDFTVPIIYTRQEPEQSSVICQINIVNQ
ncbi:MAG: hypothetical protein AAB582_02330 [Patescibacteria group bacterium]